MKYLILIGFTFLLRHGQSSCVTPYGICSQCVVLGQCPEFVEAFRLLPLPTYILDFMRDSHCGFEGITPKVCCGPLPDINASQDDPVEEEDSRPTARDKCGIDSGADKIYGGQATELDEFPWMALLGYGPANNRSHHCGGMLINHRYVLSAAHCVVGAIETVYGKPRTVRLGENDLIMNVDCDKNGCADPVQDILIQSAIPHPGYSDAFKNRKDDISLLRLAKRAQFNNYVQPICMISNNLPDVGDQLVVAGWGLTESGSGSPIKLKLGLKSFDKTQCFDRFRRVKVSLSENQICAGGQKGQDACNGDSGGPLMRNVKGTWEAVGIVSFGNGCGRNGWPGIYTSVSSYRSWIEDNMIAYNQLIKPAFTLAVPHHTNHYHQNHPYRFHFNHNHNFHNYYQQTPFHDQNTDYLLLNTFD